MPTYDYSCTTCGSFDSIRPMSLRNEMAECPECGGLSERIFAFGSNLARLDSDTRKAIEGNERAANSPMMSRDYDTGYSRMRHPSGCGCCKTGKKATTQTYANGNKSFLGKRPWMISH